MCAAIVRYHQRRYHLKTSVLSKLFERQLLDHLAVAKLLPELQLANRAHHLTETAVLKVLADILSALDTGDAARLVSSV